MVVVDPVGSRTGRYRIVGRTRCFACGGTVILGTATMAAVRKPDCVAVCLPCIRKMGERGELTEDMRIGRVVDAP